ncbi:winged helix-turn-helix transcriptional regulator [Desertihabitans aurantiacus]|uniref:winged helix-turn-helix transcriptional regulator n=1 Tax=Desertihabitans aurantiacus TaxID=2282477 RepID=UPI001E4F1291|nr:helix-turn-helix domain-containing protein [Desertihabitans aurantiacus]
MARAVDVLGDRWALLVVRDAFDGITRFSDFQRSLGAAKNILTSRLRALVDAGILEVVPASDGSAYHEYALTDRGRDLFTVIVALRQWGEAHLFADGEHHSELLDATGARPLRRIAVLDAAGRALTASETFVRKVSHESA